MTDREITELRRIAAMLTATNKASGEQFARRMAETEERLALFVENAETAAERAIKIANLERQLRDTESWLSSAYGNTWGGYIEGMEGTAASLRNQIVALREGG